MCVCVCVCVCVCMRKCAHCSVLPLWRMAVFNFAHPPVPDFPLLVPARFFLAPLRGFYIPADIFCLIIAGYFTASVLLLAPHTGVKTWTSGSMTGRPSPTRRVYRLWIVGRPPDVEG